MDFINYISLTIILLYGCAAVKAYDENRANKHFKSDFKFGASTSALQIEGGWNTSGKGISIWDHAFLRNPNVFLSDFHRNFGPDSFHHFDEDIRVLKETKFDFYRFSISWTRIMPNGFSSSINQNGLDYYNRLIYRLLENGIEPMVTMHHFDLPQSLQDLGGWSNENMVHYFLDYANVLFEYFGDRVHKWITINEPHMMCLRGYGLGNMPPFVYGPGKIDYYCGHNVLKAHAMVYRLYKSKYYEMYRGRVGIALNARYLYADSRNSDQSLPEKAIQFTLGWFAHPIFTKNGDYPEIMRRIIDENSKNEGRSWSRLPKFTKSWRLAIRNSADFMALNYYTSRLVEIASKPLEPIPSMDYDLNLTQKVDPSWECAIEGNVFCSVPQGFGDLLRWINNEYENVEVIITENGWPDNHGNWNDSRRIVYIKDHLRQVEVAVNKDNCNVTGYAIWSLLDNFELTDGYTVKFGIFSIEPDTKKRLPKKSAGVVRQIIESRMIPEN